jgi:phage shock protein B
MYGVMIVSVIFAGIVLSLTVIGITILLGIKIFKGGVSRRQQQTEAREARMIQEIHKGLSGLETRIEALETIVFEHQQGAAGNETH